MNLAPFLLIGLDALVKQQLADLRDIPLLAISYLLNVALERLNSGLSGNTEKLGIRQSPA